MYTTEPLTALWLLCLPSRGVSLNGLALLCASCLKFILKCPIVRKKLSGLQLDQYLFTVSRGKKCKDITTLKKNVSMTIRIGIVAVIPKYFSRNTFEIKNLEKKVVVFFCYNHCCLVYNASVKLQKVHLHLSPRMPSIVCLVRESFSSISLFTTSSSYSSSSPTPPNLDRRMRLIALTWYIKGDKNILRKSRDVSANTIVNSKK